MYLSDIVTPENIIARSVNIERDFGNKDTLSQYILTQKGLEIINRFILSLKDSSQTSWSLTGPYGMGKSSFVNFLISLLGSENSEDGEIARNILKKKSEKSYNQFQDCTSVYFNNHQEFLRVAATCSFEPVNLTISNSLNDTLQRNLTNCRSKKKVYQLIKKVEAFSEGDSTNTNQLVEYIKEAGEIFSAPIVMVLDEFGKSLEYMAQYPELGDVFIIQSLAESKGVFLWVCLHQAFEEYASDLSGKQLQEWGKIQGRFEDISFVEPQQQMIEFISHTLKRINGASKYEQDISTWAAYYFDQFKSLSLPNHLSLSLQTIKNCYPLHPLVVLALPELCTRFAQNDRTLFAFLCSGEPHALPCFLQNNPVKNDSEDIATFKPSYLYDYFLSVTNSTLSNRPESKRWFEVSSIVNEVRNFSVDEQDLVKNIGLLNLLAEPTGLRASRDITQFAIEAFGASHEDKARAGDLLNLLTDKGIVIYRDYADEYRLWEGTDIDIPASLIEYKERLGNIDLTDTLQTIASLTPLIASRHSYETGTLRYFERCWSSYNDIEKCLKNISSEADGLLIHCFDLNRKVVKLPSKTPDGKPVIVAYTPCEDKLRDAIIDSAALRYMLNESSELARDGVARKEASFRFKTAEKRLRQLLDSLFFPGSKKVTWYLKGEIKEVISQRDLSKHISYICNKTYKYCPVIRNELINRENLSSATARARRELIEAMITNGDEATLSMTGTGPEVAIYRTMLLKENLHDYADEGGLEFKEPNKKSSFINVWKALDNCFDELDGEVNVSSIIKMLKLPPFGLKYGPIPIIFSLYLLVKSEEVALFREGTFLPYLQPEEMELLVKRPDLFTIKRFVPTGVRSKVFKQYQKLINTSIPPDQISTRNATLVSVVGPLVQFANSLSDYVLYTKNISVEAQNVRRVLLNTKDPIKLIFAELPGVLGYQTLGENNELSSGWMDGFEKDLRETLLELTRADSFLLQDIESAIKNCFNYQVNDTLLSLRKQLKQRTKLLAERCVDSHLKSFILALQKEFKSDQEWIVAVATIVSQVPVDSWDDTKLQQFATQLSDYVERLQSFEALVMSELKSVESNEKQKTRYVTVMNSEGVSHKKIIRVEHSKVKELDSTMSELKKSYSFEELEALLLLLSDTIFAEK